MIDIHGWVFGLLVLGGMLAMFGLGLAIGREWPSRRAVEERYGLEVSDVEGYNNGREVPAHDTWHATGVPHGDAEAPVLAMPDLPAAASALGLPARTVTQVYRPLEPYADWREQTAAELAPAHLDELAERIDLPGPAALGFPVTEQADCRRAGELDWPTDTRLPAILTLGQAGDGSDKTFARASLAQWDFMVRFRDERDELDRMLAAGRAA
jgi:hypothetical protein